MKNKLIRNMITGILAASVMMFAAGCARNVTVNINNNPEAADEAEADEEVQSVGRGKHHSVFSDRSRP